MGQKINLINKTMKKEEIIKELDELGDVLYNKFGTDSYLERCTIHDLKTKIKALTLGGVSNWVAVTEKLPLVDGFYLVYIDGLTEDKALFKNNEFHVRDETLMDMEITHWMHLPKPPCC